MSKIMRWLMAGLVLVVLSGCGGGGGNPPADDFVLFETYAQNDGGTTAPTADDYRNAGVRGVTAANLDDVNEAVAGLDSDAVDSVGELQDIADRFRLNTVPTANAGDDKTVTEGSTATLTCKGSGADEDALSYRWLDGTTELLKSATYTTPDDLGVGEHTYMCEVSDDTDKATDSVKVTVTANAAANVAPTADINATPTTATYGTTISFDASGSSDSDGSIDKYRWSEGATTLSESINFTKDNLGIGTHTITLTVTDDNETTDSTTVKIVIQQANGLKKTGQTKSYDGGGNEVTDGSIKDDGYYQTGVVPSYTRDDAANIVTDHITGLQWQDDVAVKTVRKPWLTWENYEACRGSLGHPSQPSKCNDTSGDTVTTYCADLALGGHSDWRLPTRKELISIVDYGKNSPAMDTAYFQNVEANGGSHWSSTTDAYNSANAWATTFVFGAQGESEKLVSFYVRCVRAEQ